MKPMNTKEYDKMLGIHTTSIGERPNQSAHYHHYEATPYRILDALFEEYELLKTDGFVDIGCGKGRVLFYVHNRFHCSVKGIEMNEQLFRRALENEESYMQKVKKNKGFIRIECSLAETYSVEENDNRFFFFNPFSIQILRKVVDNIQSSVEQWKRDVDVILYYPTAEYIEYLETHTPFKLVQEVKVPGLSEINPSERFVIFRYEP